MEEINDDQITEFLKYLQYFITDANAHYSKNYFHFQFHSHLDSIIMLSLKLLQTLTQCNSARTVFIYGRILSVDILNCKRNILKCYSTQNQEQSSKETRENSKPKTGTELDVKRKSPYEGLSAGQKGKGILWIWINITLRMLYIHVYTGMSYVSPSRFICKYQVLLLFHYSCGGRKRPDIHSCDSGWRWINW